MLKLIKKWWLARQYPIDELFNNRPQSSVRFGDWVLVELGATEYILVMDTLNQIRISTEDSDTKGRQILGLRLQVLAMSVRTPKGKIPLDWRNEKDLMFLASLPFSETVKPLAAIAELSDMSWLDPMMEQSNQESPEQPENALQEDVETNPS